MTAHPPSQPTAPTFIPPTPLAAQPPSVKVSKHQPSRRSVNLCVPRAMPTPPVYFAKQVPGRDFHGIPNPAPGTPLTLSDLRQRLIRQEETIIFSLIERAQFSLNEIIYTPHAFDLPPYDAHLRNSDVDNDSESQKAKGHSVQHLGDDNGDDDDEMLWHRFQKDNSLQCDGSFSQHMLYEMEKVHARMRRFTSPDEHPFAPEHLLPSPILPELDYPSTLDKNSINVNGIIERVYRHSILSTICNSDDDDDDQNYGSAAICDSICLQALSKRIHYGKFIAEAKCQAEDDKYRRMALDNAKDDIWNELSNFEVERLLLKRVTNKARSYGSDITVEGANDVFKVEPEVIAELYRDFIIPLTKEVEVQYVIHKYRQDR